MLLREYLNEDGHAGRILIVSDPVKGQMLLRMHEASSGTMIRNVRCLTILQMAEELYRYFCSENGFADEYEYPDTAEAGMIFRGVLFRNLGKLRYFKREEMMDLATTAEIFRKVQLIRANGWSGEEEKEQNDRVFDLKLLIAAYEDLLASEKTMDVPGKLRYVLEKLEALPDPRAEIRNVFAAHISYLKEDAEALDGMRKRLLRLLCDGEEAEVSVFPEDLHLETIVKSGAEVFFYKGYGSFNEAAFVANDILEKKHPFGEVTVLYGSAAQLPAISAALCGNGIPMRIVSAHSAKENAYIALARRILAWAGDDYSEKMLERILVSPVICTGAKDENGEDADPLAGQRYFDHVRNAADRREDGFVLGWGYERNLRFLQHEEEFAAEEPEKAVLALHRALLEIFSPESGLYEAGNLLQPYTVYARLVDFLERYTRGGEDRALPMESLRRLAGAVRLEKRDLSRAELLRFLDELLSALTVTDAESGTAVTVRSVGGFSVPERSVIYVTGLALKDLQGSTTESPVLFDEEMERFLAAGYCPTIRNETERKEKELRYTLGLFRGKQITLGYSDYDTVGFCVNNASAFFREAAAAMNVQPEDLPEFVYGNPTEPVGEDGRALREKIKCGDVRQMTSNSSLEVLLDCPRKYAYAKILHIPEDEFTECDYDRWLDARLKGSFFHEIAEKYSREKLILPAGEYYESEVDRACVTRIVEEIEERLLMTAPCAFRALADRETEMMIRDAVRYLQILLDSLNDDSWRVLAAEQPFGGAEFPVKDLSGKEYPFMLTGFIDRIDYRIDHEEKKISLRIADYKTGKQERKANEDMLGKLVQYLVYEKAVMESGKVKEEDKDEVLLSELLRGQVAGLEKDPAVKDYDLVYDCFRYEFPMDRKADGPMSITAEDAEGMNLLRLRAILSTVEESNAYPDHEELLLKLGELAEAHPEEADALRTLQTIMTERWKTETENCAYCSYRYLCTVGRAGDLS